MKIMKTQYILKISALILVTATFLACGARLNPNYDPSDPDSPTLIYPKAQLGASLGGSLGSDDQSAFCIGGDYFHRVSGEDRNVGSYLGATALYDFNSFGDDSKFRILNLGLKYEARVPISRKREAQWVIGGRGSYDFGKDEFNNFEQDIRGYTLGIYSGLNLSLTDRINLGIAFPLVSYNDYTFEDEFGDEFDDTNTEIFMNKHNPAMLYVRFNLNNRLNLRD